MASTMTTTTTTTQLQKRRNIWAPSPPALIARLPNTFTLAPPPGLRAPQHRNTPAHRAPKVSNGAIRVSDPAAYIARRRAFPCDPLQSYFLSKHFLSNGNGRSYLNSDITIPVVRFGFFEVTVVDELSDDDLVVVRIVDHSDGSVSDLPPCHPRDLALCHRYFLLLNNHRHATYAEKVRGRDLDIARQIVDQAEVILEGAVAKLRQTQGDVDVLVERGKVSEAKKELLIARGVYKRLESELELCKERVKAEVWRVECFHRRL
ncbi:hypothetical protein FN846DRAFT_892666 [Sphaerosporella brunnea]|uniref:Uncharacterized protein n=1 Tax=Sphaerosporella brunnea TaxID=1250544 RepID=A0A5J5EPI8_9PEZI|nr:hypothetical protein FN846DRAFT_892666 [Sphaerosporella brunnea]